MRLHKKATTEAVPFYQILNEKQRIAENSQLNPAKSSYLKYEESSISGKTTFSIDLLISFKKDLSEVSDFRETFELLKKYAKKIIPVKECSYFRYDEKTGALFQSKIEQGSEISTAMQRYWKEGILQAVFDTKEPTLLPSLINYGSDGPTLSYYVHPAFDCGSKVGMFVILTPANKSSFKKFEKDSLGLLIDSAVSQLERLALRERLNSVYGEMQTYQAKLSNDFRLAAIGELTEGVLEDIGTPLQVILSQVDFLSAEQSDENGLGRIRSQVVKIQQVINRLVKFADVNQKQVSILPCNVNDLLKEYYALVKSSLDNLSMECALDLGKNIPPILTHSSYFFQILANLFGLLKSYMGEFGGIILQTRHEEESVVVRITATADMSAFVKTKKTKNENLNVRIVNNFMKKHEGNFAVESTGKSSTIMSLTFPIRRKIRQ